MTVQPPARPKRNPTPSLLTSLLTDHLDPGYTAAAVERSAHHVRSPRVPPVLWLITGAVAVGVVFGGAMSQLASDAAEIDRASADASAAVRAAQEREAELDVTRDELAAQVSTERDRALQSDAAGSELLDRLDAVESAAGIDSVTGPGLSVVVTEPAAGGASDRSVRTGSGATVLDRDIAAVVNSLWASGAEAVSVDGNRVGPNVTIRQAGGAMLLDNRPITSPYDIDAIGPPQRIQVQFAVSDAYLRMSTVAQLYGVGFSVRPATDLEFGPAVARESFEAKEVAPR